MIGQTRGGAGVEAGPGSRDDEAVTPPARLFSDQGQELLGWLAGQDGTADSALRLASELRGRYPSDLIAAALTQQSLRVAGRAKFSQADSMYFTRAGLEQASSELTARHAAERFAGLALVGDLCCGIGGNTAALAAVAGAVLAVDADLETLLFARRNVEVLGAPAQITAVCADVQRLAFGGARLAGIFIDPARRAGGRRLRTGDSLPPLDWCLGLAGLVPAVGHQGGARPAARRGPR